MLEEMIRDRESQITVIKKKLDDQKKKMERLKKHLENVKEKLKTDTMEQQLEIETLVQRHGKLRMNYHETKDGLDMKKQQQGTQLRLYNEVMKSVAAPESRDSSYVMRMQAQLCKAMHSMGMVETQLAMTATQSDALQKQMKDTITRTVEEKSQVELMLMNDLVLVDNARREAETKIKDLMESFSKEKDTLLERIEREKEEPLEEEDEDEEEREELMEILEQGKEEIERMEQENKEEYEKLEALKLKVAGIRGEGLVEEIVNSISEEFREREEEEGSDEE